MKTVSLHKRVIVSSTKQTGSVTGFGVEINELGDAQPIILVRLDEGFYNPERTGYVSLLAVAKDGIEEI